MNRQALALGLLGLVLAAASGCSPIAREHREAAVRDVPFGTVLADPEAYKGKIFIWGGWIVETANRPEGTELVVLQAPLDSGDEPREAARTQGRFLAKTAQFLDPALYCRGRRLTVAGELAGRETRKLDQAEYAYPVLTARQLHLWAEERRRGPRFSVGLGVGIGL
jgi:outer membrane lipoprotein